MHGHWEHFEHGADNGVRGFGDTEAAATDDAQAVAVAGQAHPSVRLEQLIRSES